MDKISNKIDIQLNLRSMSEDNMSPSDYGTDEINVKRWGSDLENDADIRGESQMEPHKRVKLWENPRQEKMRQQFFHDFWKLFVTFWLPL